MTAPHPLLSDLYSTKTASGAGAIAASVLTHEFMQRNAEAQARMIAEAERMNHVARLLQERKMRATQRGLSLGRGGPVSDLVRYEDMDIGPALFNSSLFKGGSASLAEGAARSMAQQMNKEAIGGAFMAKLLGGAGKKLLGAAGKAGGGTASKLLGGAGSAATRGASRLGGVAKTQAMPAVGKVTSTMKAPAAAAAKAPVGAAGAAGAAKAAPAGPGLWQQTKKAITPSWKTKALLGGTALLGMGGLYAGGKAARDYMMMPSGTGGWGPGYGGWQGGYGVRHNVSGYGGGYAY